MNQESYFKGKGAQFNPKNKFTTLEYVQEHIEGLDEELQEYPQTQVFYEHPQKIVSHVKSEDLGFHLSVNPYQGCEHGCIYCYARNSHEYWGFSAGLDFESKIIAKPGAAKILENELLNCNWPMEPLMFSGNTDCYQPLEKKLKITRSMLEVLTKYRYPVSIITKNSLITRDIDLLQDLAKDNLVNVMISLTTLDDSLRQKLEPRTAAASKKLKTIERLSNAAIPVGIMAAPIIPGLNDHEIPEIIKAASEAGATDAGYTVCRLNGAVGPLFQNWLTKNFPNKANKVWNQIASMHGGQVNDSEWHRRMRGTGPIAFTINQLFEKSRKMYMPNSGFAPLDLTKFRRGGNLQLF